MQDKQLFYVYQYFLYYYLHYHVNNNKENTYIHKKLFILQKKTFDKFNK